MKVKYIFLQVFLSTISVALLVEVKKIYVIERDIKTGINTYIINTHAYLLFYLKYTMKYLRWYYYYYHTTYYLPTHFMHNAYNIQ